MDHSPRVRDVAFGELRLLVCPANERLRHAHPGAVMLTLAAPSGSGALGLPSRTVAAGPTCCAQVAADLSASGIGAPFRQCHTEPGHLCAAMPTARWCGDPPTSEQMAQQVDITLGPGLLPECLDHHGTRICLPGQPQRDVVVDLHPGAAVHDPRPPVPGAQPVIVSK